MRRAAVGRWGEALGWLVALALSTATTAVIATARAWMMFLDGDSVVTVLIAKSVRLGQAQDWAMSPVMFFPEAALHLLLSFAGLGVRGTLVLNAVVNLLLLYGAIRVVAGSRAQRPGAVIGAVGAFAVFCGLAALEASGERFFLFAGLMTFTTYYSATVVAAVLTIGIIRRIVDAGRAGRLPLLLLGGIAFVSMATNPLYAVWAAAPLCAVVALLAVTRRVDGSLATSVLTSLVVGSAAGLALHEIVFARWIMAERGDYLRPDLLPQALEYYGGFLAGIPANPGGPAWLVVLIVLWMLTGVLAVRGWRRRDAGTALVALTAIAAPLASVVLTLAIGSEAVRYLQPFVFLPVLTLALLPGARNEPAGHPARVRAEAGAPRHARASAHAGAAHRRASRPAGSLAVSAVLAAGSAVAVALALPPLVRASTAVDRDVACVTAWMEETGATGVGDFWTIRGPKAYLEDPSPLIQITHDFIVWPWLTNRTDYAGAEATFVLIDHHSPELIYPQGFSAEQAHPVACGRYTILDFDERVLPLGR